AGHLVVKVRYTGSVWDAEAAGGYRRVHPGIGRLTDETAPAAVESGTVTAARGTYRLRSLHRDVTVDFRPLGSWKRHSRSSRRETLIAAEPPDGARSPSGRAPPPIPWQHRAEGYRHG